MSRITSCGSIFGCGATIDPHLQTIDYANAKENLKDRILSKKIPL